MFNYLSSYLVGAVEDKQEQNQANELDNKREELRQYDQQPVKRAEDQSQQAA